MDNEHIFYPDFDHPASQLSAFTFCIDLFILSLKNGEIVRFEPEDILHFGEWLKKNGVRDIRVDNGKVHIPQPVGARFCNFKKKIK